MKRLGIYVFWEKKGIVRDFVFYYLNGLKKVTEKIYVVVNGIILDKYKTKLEAKGYHIIVRPNIGLDFAAYKEALNKEKQYGRKYDQIILCNCSCYGPVYPFEEMFSQMDNKHVDFWGITSWPLDQYGYKGTWVLSYFIVINNTILKSKYWGEYWDNLYIAKDRDEAVRINEIGFSNYFTSKGYKFDVYCRNSGKYFDSTIEAPYELVREKKCPIIKRKAFCVEYDRYFSIRRGKSARELIEFLKKEQLYNINYIFDDLLATQHYSDIKNALNLIYVLPEERILSKTSNRKILVAVHLYYTDLIDIYIKYILRICNFCDIVITTPKEEVKCKIINKYPELRYKDIRIISSRGRAESAFLVGIKDIVFDYDYVCIVHDKKSAILNPSSMGIEFGLHNFDALIKNENYVRNIIGIFENNPRIGILEPINVMFADFRGLYGNEWSSNFVNTTALLSKASVNVPIDEAHPPICPMGAMFWFRPDALKKLISLNWTYQDFPKEPLPHDGSLIHSIERAYPYFAQDQGYLIAWVCSDIDAENHLTNLAYLYRLRNLQIMQSSSKSKPVAISVKHHTPIFIRNFERMIRHYFKKELKKMIS